MMIKLTNKLKKFFEMIDQETKCKLSNLKRFLKIIKVVKMYNKEHKMMKTFSSYADLMEGLLFVSF